MSQFETSTTLFRANIGEHMTRAVHEHRPTAIRRGSRDLALLIGAQDLIKLMPQQRFSPEVLASDEGVSVWLPEFEIYGQGTTLAEAMIDLEAEVREYINWYLESDASRAPNRSHQFAHVLRALIADVNSRLHDELFSEAQPAAV